MDVSGYATSDPKEKRGQTVDVFVGSEEQVEVPTGTLWDVFVIGRVSDNPVELLNESKNVMSALIETTSDGHDRADVTLYGSKYIDCNSDSGGGSSEAIIQGRELTHD